LRISIDALYGRHAPNEQNHKIVKKGGREFADKVVQSLQKVVKDCLVLSIDAMGRTSGRPQYYELKYKAGEGATHKCCLENPNVKRLKEAIDNKHQIIIFHEKNPTGASMHVGPVDGPTTKIYLDPTVLTDPISLAEGGSRRVGIDVVAWHEVVGHGGERIKSILKNDKSIVYLHPKENWNRIGEVNTQQDPINAIENEARAVLNIPLRDPHYWPASNNFDD
jgi:hypothetical protein